MIEQLNAVQRWREASFVSRLNASSSTCRTLNNRGSSGDVGVIFIVDDNPCIAELYSIFLEPEGYHLRFFRDRLAALRELERADEAPDLLITDYLGHALEFETFLLRVQEIFTSPLLVISGLPNVAATFLREGSIGLLPKPFTREELVHEVRATIQRATWCWEMQPLSASSRTK